MRRAQTDANTQARQNLITNPSFETPNGVVALRYNLHTNPGFETGSGTVNVRTNLASNPSFEAAAGTVNVRTNLCTNPSMETSSGTVTTRTNLAPNPSAVNSAGWFSANGVAVNFAVNQSGGPVGNTYARATSTGTATGLTYFGIAYGQPGGTAAQVTAGTAYTLSAYVRVTMSSFSMQPSLRLRWKDSAGTTLADITSTATGATSGNWVRLSASGTAPASASYIEVLGGYIAIDQATIPVGSTVDMSAVLVEASLSSVLPYFDGTVSIQNLVSNSRGVTAYPDYSGAGNQTITANVAITGNPDGIATANRVSYSGGASNPGISFVNPSTIGVTYTMSAWVYHETIPSSGSQGFAQAGVTSMPSPPAMVQGVWQRISWTYTATSTSQLGFRIGSPGSAGSFLITGLLVERSSTLSPFYDGLGDFTYTWSGTANASTSNQRATGLSSWTLSSQASVYQSSLDPKIGSKSAGVVTKGVNGDGAYFADVAAVAGRYYTFSAWVKATTAHTLTGLLRFKDNANTTLADVPNEVSSSLVLGSWTRVSVTGIAPANTTKLQAMWRVLTTHTATTFYLDGALIMEAGDDVAYFDGSTAASGDFTYAWSGTAHASSSYQQAPTVATWVNRWFGAGGGTGVLYQAKGGFSGNYARKLWTQANTGATMDAGINTPLTPVSASTPYTLSAWVRCSVAQYFNFYIDWKDATDTRVGVTQQSTGTSVPANTWTRLSVTSTAPTAATQANFTLGPYGGALSMPAGATMDFDHCLIEASPTMQDYFDGSNPITNLVTNPSFETGTTGWVGKGVTPPTFALDTSIVNLGSKSLKVTAQSTTAAGVGIDVTGLTVGKKYTMSGYAYSPTGNANVVSTISGIGYGTATSTKDVWTRLVMTFVAANTTQQVGFDFSSQATGSIFYLDAVMLNAGDTALPYQEGQGDFTYVWSGAANASNSYQQAPGVAGIATNISGAAGSLSKIYQTKSGLSGKGVKITKQGGYVYVDYTMTGLAASTTYTFSYDVLTSQDKISTVDRGTGPAPIYSPLDKTVTPNVWTRVNRQVTTGAGETTRVLSLAGWEMATVPDGSSVIIDNLLLEVGSGKLVTYFDGSTTATNDFTYAWTGTANASTSEQRGIRVNGFSGLYSNRIAWQSTDWSALGTKSLAVLGGVPSIDCFSQFDNVSTLPANVAGKTYTIMGRLRTVEAFPVGADSRAWSFHLVYNLSSGGTGLFTCKPVTTYAGVHEVRQTFTFPANATTVAFMRFYNGSPNPVPVYWDQVGIFEGTYTGDYIDGTNPLSKWTGTAHASTSIGYPPQLIDIAGAPLFNGTDLAIGSTYTIPSGPITVYTVQSLGVTTNNPGYWEYSTTGAWNTSTGIVRLIGSLPTMGRLDHIKPAGGGNNLSVLLDPMNLAVTATAFDPTVTGTFYQTNGGSTYTVAADATYRPATGGILKIGVRDNGSQSAPVVTKRVLVYTGQHDLTIRQAISRYLGNKYGIAVS